MINNNREAAYVNNYLLEKEFFLPDNVRNALSKISYYMRKKGDNKTNAVHKTHNFYKYKKNVILEKEYLSRQFNIRQAHIKNGKEKFKDWAKEMRERSCGIKKKLCECGCGLEVTKKGNKYIHGHHRRCLSKDEKNENAKHMREVKALKNRKDNVIFIDNLKYKIL